MQNNYSMHRAYFVVPDAMPAIQYCTKYFVSEVGAARSCEQHVRVETTPVKKRRVSSPGPTSPAHPEAAPLPSPWHVSSGSARDAPPEQPEGDGDDKSDADESSADDERGGEAEEKDDEEVVDEGTFEPPSPREDESQGEVAPEG